MKPNRISLSPIRVLVLTAIVWGILFGTDFLTSVVKAEDYTSPEGIRVHTDSPAWSSQDKLKQVYEELKKNVHGEEWGLLTQITIHDTYVKGKSVAGEYNLQVSVDLLGRKKMLPGSIEIYGGSERTTIESIAKTLSHEYGHHVTHYFSLKQDGFPLSDPDRWKESTYAKLRGLTQNPHVNKEKEHRWDLAEIAAEDYVQLFGTPTAKQIHPFASYYDLLQKGREIGPVQWDASMFNLAPQENLDLPLATKVPGLYDWLAGNIGASRKPKIPAEPQLNVKEVIKEKEGTYQIRFDWSGEKDPSLVYTLVSYGDSGQVLPEPIVTRNGTERLEARYGSFVITTATSILTYTDPNAKGIRHFRVYAQNQAGFVSSSPILTVDMDHPQQVTITDLAVEQQPVDAAIPVQVKNRPAIPLQLSGVAEWIVRAISEIVVLISRVLEDLLKLAS